MIIYQIVEAHMKIQFFDKIINLYLMQFHYLNIWLKLIGIQNFMNLFFLNYKYPD